MNHTQNPFSPEERLYAMYGKNPPIQAVSRLKTERFLFPRNLYSDLDLIMELQHAAEAAGTDVTAIGFGASFIAWLFGCTVVNPLPPHRLSPVDNPFVFCCDGDGWDMPTLIGQNDEVCWEGHEIPIESMLGRIRDPNPQLDFRLAESFADQAALIIRNYFRRQDASLVQFSPEPEGFRGRSFALVPKDAPMFEIAEDGVWHTGLEEVHNMKYRVVNLIFDDRKEKLRQFRAEPGKAPAMADLLTETILAATAEKIASELSAGGGTLLEPDKLCFSSLLQMYGYLHSTHTEDNPVYQQEGVHYSDVFCFREQVWSLIQSSMDPEYRISSEFAYHVAKLTRSGRFTRNRMDPETELTLRGLGISEHWIEQMKHTFYLPSKADLICSLLDEMRLAWYNLRKDSYSERSEHI